MQLNLVQVQQQIRDHEEEREFGYHQGEVLVAVPLPTEMLLLLLRSFLLLGSALQCMFSDIPLTPQQGKEPARVQPSKEDSVKRRSGKWRTGERNFPCSLVHTPHTCARLYISARIPRIGFLTVRVLLLKEVRQYSTSGCVRRAIVTNCEKDKVPSLLFFTTHSAESGCDRRTAVFSCLLQTFFKSDIADSWG